MKKRGKTKMIKTKAIMPKYIEKIIVTDFQLMRKNNKDISFHFLDALIHLSSAKTELEERNDIILEDYLWARKLLFETEIGQIGRGWQQFKRFNKMTRLIAPPFNQIEINKIIETSEKQQMLGCKLYH